MHRPEMLIVSIVVGFREARLLLRTGSVPKWLPGGLQAVVGALAREALLVNWGHHCPSAERWHRLCR